MSASHRAGHETVVSVDMGSSIGPTIIIVLTAPCWFPAVAAMHLKFKYRQWRGRKTEAAYLKTREKNETARPEQFPLAVAIERDAGRQITMETAVSERNLARCQPQNHSPLFALPAELRTLIYKLVLLDETDRPLPFASRKPVCGVNLLQTCRQAWLEGNKLAPTPEDSVLWLVDPFAGVYGHDLYDLRKTFDAHFGHFSAARAARLRSTRIVIPLVWIGDGVIWELLATAAPTIPSRVTIAFWHGVDEPFHLFWSYLNDGCFLRYAKAGGIRDLMLEFISWNEPESLRFNALLLGLENSHSRQPGWRLRKSSEWKPVLIEAGTSHGQYRMKTFHWTFEGNTDGLRDPLLSALLTKLEERAKATTALEVSMQSRYTQQWDTQQSLLKFV